jgi:hypothetical protein
MNMDLEVYARFIALRNAGRYPGGAATSLATIDSDSCYNGSMFSLRVHEILHI